MAGCTPCRALGGQRLRCVHVRTLLVHTSCRVRRLPIHARTHGYPGTFTRQGCTHTHTHLAIDAPDGEGQVALAAPCKEEQCRAWQAEGYRVSIYMHVLGAEQFCRRPRGWQQRRRFKHQRASSKQQSPSSRRGRQMPWQRHAAAREGLQTRWKRNKREHCSSKQAAFAAVRNQVQPSRMPAGLQQCRQQATANMNSNSPLMKIAGAGAAITACKNLEHKTSPPPLLQQQHQRLDRRRAAAPKGSSL